MLFNSVDFTIFLPVVFVLYWFVTQKNLKAQNILLLFASYFFYAYWDYRFLLLLVSSITLDFIIGKKIDRAGTAANRKLWLWLSVSLNLSVLGFFKYYNFFVLSFAHALAPIGINADVATLNLILPLGISFYTFHELSYIIDIYRKKIKPVSSYVDYSLFVSFFPLLIAGPIERAGHLLPQIQKKRVFNNNYAVDGLRQILWGLFKKIVVADNCGYYANLVFNNSSHYNGSAHVIGAVFFAIQIYGDFSGYSDIALGAARLLGFELYRNFAFPYFSRDIAEFWRRWHISLTSWFRDYVYVPLGGSRGSVWMQVRNVLLVFLISGFWHGANFTFIVWGALNALYYIPLLIFKRTRAHLDIVAKGRNLPTVSELLGIITTFGLTVFAWIFFRAKSVHDALGYISKIFSRSLFSRSGIGISPPLVLIVLLFIMMEWFGREQEYAIQKMYVKLPRALRWSFYFVLMMMIITWDRREQEFIYFHF
ncbi:MBOAT family protein [soil metagenome]|jgi:alginate O-acetyltransferase complex protein AlgI